MQGVSYITSVRGNGLGNQGISALTAIALAREMGIEYRHSPFTYIAHCPNSNTEEYADKWEHLLNLGHGARSAKFAHIRKFKVVILVNNYPTETNSNLPNNDRLKTWSQWSRVNLKHAQVVPMGEFVTHLNRQNQTNDNMFYVVCSNIHQPHRMKTLGDTLNSIRLNYQHSTEEKAGLLLDNNFLNIAVHLRGGDIVNPETHHQRAHKIKLLEISSAMPKLMRKLSRILNEMQLPHLFSVYAEKDADFVEEMLGESGTEYNLRIGKSPFADFHQMVSADILIHNGSTFSIFAGFLSENIKLTFSDDMRLPGWIKWDAMDGSFDASELKKLLCEKL